MQVLCGRQSSSGAMKKSPWVLLLLVAATTMAGAAVHAVADSSGALLECVCSKHTSDCDAATARCSTDGMCFSSLKRIRGKRSGKLRIVRIDRCVDADFLIPRQRPLICEYNRHQNHTYISACCDNHNLCNSAQQLPLRSVMQLPTTSCIDLFRSN